MSYALRLGENFLSLEQFVRGMEIVTSYTEVSAYELATHFETKDAADKMLKELMEYEDTKKIEVVSLEQINAKIEEEAKKLEQILKELS